MSGFGLTGLHAQIASLLADVTPTERYGSVVSTSKGGAPLEDAGSVWDEHGELTLKCMDAGTVNIIAHPKYTVIMGYFYYPANPGLIIDHGDNSTGHFNPVDLGAGTHVITFEYMAMEGSFTIQQEFTIYDVAGKAIIGNLDTSYCNYGQSVIITANTTSGTGKFFGPSVGFTTDYSIGSKATLDISALSGVVASDTTHTITYVYTSTECGCTDTVTQDITIHNLPQLSFTLKDTFNINEGVTSITGISPSGGIFSGDGIDAVNHTFSPSLAGPGSHTVQYTYSNTYGCSNSLSKTVIVVNNAPVARDTTISTTTGTPITIMIPANDVDGTISILYISDYPENGGITISGTSLTYIPEAGYSGSDTLTWYVVDNWATQSNIATMVIQVKKVYYNITYNLGGGINNVANDTTYVFGTGLLLSNPTKTGCTFGGWFDNETYTGTAITAISATAKGDTTLYAKWKTNTYNISYILDGGTNDTANTATYTYSVGLTLNDPVKTAYTFGGWFNNGNFTGAAVTAISDTATGDITLYARWINNVPVISSIAPTTATEDDTYTYTVIAYDPEGSMLTYSLSYYPAGMTITGNIISWIPGEGVASDSVRLLVTDGSMMATQSFNINVTSVNDAPVICLSQLSTTEDTPIAKLLATDIDSDSISCTFLASAVNGTINTVNDSLVYTPNMNFYGNDSVQIVVSDGFLTDTAWVYITVTPVNDAPVASDTVINVFTATTVYIASPALDTDGTISQVFIDKYPANGIAMVVNTFLVYISDTGFMGNDTIKWFAKDNGGLYSSTAMLIITVTAKPTYTIIASAGNGGSISPSDTISVEDGSNQTFTITADSGYIINDVLVDGTSVGNVVTYTFDSVISNHTIEASFITESGIDDIQANDIRLYPNPCSNGFYIYTGEKIHTLYIYDITGKPVYMKQSIGTSYVDTENFKAGIYIVKVNEKTYKLVKE